MVGESGDKSFEVKQCDSFTSFLPESDYVSQGLDRFPLLVWKSILENCWSWNYLEMLKFFETVKLPGDFLSDPTLHSVRKNIFFHALLPTLTSNYVKSGYVSDHDSLLEFEDINNCRLVCRAWNSAIRKNVVEHVSRSHPNCCCFHEWENNFLWPRESLNPYANNCNSAYSLFSSRITKFLSHFSQIPKSQGDVSPFHCHHVRFQLSSHNDMQWMGGITTSTAVFFAKYGGKLRLVNFSLYSREAYQAGCFYPSVLDLLRESLNLEALRISWRCPYSDGIEGFLKRHVNAGSFPQLKLLTHLEVDGLPHLLFNDIIRSNGGHIEKLKISGLKGTSYALFRKYALHRIPLKNLRELRISFECATNNDILRLAKSAPHWTKLNKVYLDFEGGNTSQKDISWSFIIQCLNKFSESVTHIWLSFHTLTSQDMGLLHGYCPTREERLKLPNLEHVVLKFPQGYAFSLDFLFGLEKLQTLYIRELGVSLITFDEIYIKKFVQVREYLNNKRGPEKIDHLLSSDLQYSNIWEQLPKLSKLYWRQPEKKCAWKKKKSLKRKSRAEPTTWTLRDRV